MNFLEAVKKDTNTTPFQEKKTQTVIKNEHIDSVDDMYYRNVKDSVIAYHLPKVQLMCEDFVKETLYLDYPILQKHHEGYEDFVVEMMCLYETFADVVITEKPDENYSDSETELDPSDITDTKD